MGAIKARKVKWEKACSIHVKCDKHIQNLGRENKTKEHFERFGA